LKKNKGILSRCLVNVILPKEGTTNESPQWAALKKKSSTCPKGPQQNGSRKFKDLISHLNSP
jgi:hypothetical protein